jgi:type IV pilus assembly protein PilZ
LTHTLAAAYALISVNGEDRRNAPRAPIELRVEYKRLNSFFADYTKNISRGGTFIGTDRPLEIGTDFVFKLGVPNLAEPLVLKGKVQWIVLPHEATEERGPGMGIGFVFDSDVERERVEATVEKLMIESLGPVLYQKLIGHRRKGS